MCEKGKEMEDELSWTLTWDVFKLIISGAFSINKGSWTLTWDVFKLY